MRALSGEAWACTQEGDARHAVELLLVARELAEGPQFSDVDRADLLFRLGVCRYKLSSVATAVALFDEALALANGSDLPCDLLRADILGWRSRCRRRQRDFEAAREDVEAALELAKGVDDPRVVANTYFQASLVAERMGHWVASRNYAQQAKALYEELNDERNVGRLMLNLGGLHLLLGKPEQAIEHLKESFALAVEAGSQPDAAQALGGLAAVHLRLADYDAAEENARKALALLDGREDFLDEIGQSQLVLGRALARARSARRGGASASWPPTPYSSRWRPSGTGPERGSRVVTSRVVGTTTTRRHVSIGSPQKRSRTSGSEEGGTAMRKGRLLFWLANAALFASWIQQARPTWSDGH